jgi:hypothetical protein
LSAALGCRPNVYNAYNVDVAYIYYGD